jgi:transposase
MVLLLIIQSQQEGVHMAQVTLLAIDTSKNSFQLHGGDERGKTHLKRALSRSKFAPYIANLPKCTVVMEACGGSHHWARLFASYGHEVKLIAPHFVRPFRKSDKDDAADAEAIFEAASRPSMRYVAVKEVWQQDIQALHRIRQRLIKNHTALGNEIRGLLGEYGIVIAKGSAHLRDNLMLISEESSRLSSLFREEILKLRLELLELERRIHELTVKLEAFAKESAVCVRLMGIKGVGPITATAVIAACGGNVMNFKNGREFAASLGLVPGHTHTGGKERKVIMLRITKRGDGYLRSLLVQGALSLARGAKRESSKPLSPRRLWFNRLVEEKGAKKAAVALANKNARTIWAMLRYGTAFNESASAGIKAKAA